MSLEEELFQDNRKAKDTGSVAKYGLLEETDRKTRITTIYYMAITPELYKRLHEMLPREQKPYLYVFDHPGMNNYNSDWFWAFTRPLEDKATKDIIRWSAEHQDYRLHILEHEIEHNVDPRASEYTVDVRAHNSARDYARARFAIKYN